MTTPTINPDEMLKSMAAEAVKQHKQIRTTIRDLTLQALQMRELSLKQINSVVRKVTEGVNVGVGDSKIDVEKTLSDALAGMDEALLKVVEANEVTLQKLTEGGASFDDSSVKKGLKESSSTASSKPPETRATAPKGNGNPFSTISRRGEPKQASRRREQSVPLMQAAMRSSRETGLKVMHALTQNYATLVSGVLIGLSEALEHGKPKNNR